MTNIELKTMEAVQALNRKVKDQTKIDWEQRRYEIAKDTLQGILYGFTATKEDIEDNSESLAKCAVYLADALITELKKKKDEEV